MSVNRWIGEREGENEVKATKLTVLPKSSPLVPYSPGSLRPNAHPRIVLCLTYGLEA